MSKSIADIAEDGRIAVISADGNNLGALFESLRGLVELAAISEAVATVFKRAHEVALEHVAEDRRVPLMTGGDDVRAFLPPSAVLRYVATFARAVESGASDHARAWRDLMSTHTATRLDQLGVGIGAVIANVYYPAWRLVEYAHALERSAKTACYAGSCRSAFDFAIVTAEDSMNIEPDRTPDTHEIRPLQPCTAKWSDALDRARALARIPRAQLGALTAGADLSAEEFRNSFRYQVARSSEWKAWYAACGVDWRDPGAVIDRRPDRGTIELARLLAFEEATS